jgi:hypothetical protein
MSQLVTSFLTKYKELDSHGWWLSLFVTKPLVFILTNSIFCIPSFQRFLVYRKTSKLCWLAWDILYRVLYPFKSSRVSRYRLHKLNKIYVCSFVASFLIILQSRPLDKCLFVHSGSEVSNLCSSNWTLCSKKEGHVVGRH